jgi:hypothetical protein
LRGSGTDHAELSGSHGHGASAQKAAAMKVDVFGHPDLIHGEPPSFDGGPGAPI